MFDEEVVFQFETPSLVTIGLVSGVVYFEAKPDEPIDIRLARLAREALFEHVEDRPWAEVVDLRDVAFVDQTARDYFAQDHGRPPVATAVVTGDRVGSFIGESFTKHSHPTWPAETFDDVETAYRWALERLSAAKGTRDRPAD